MKNIFFYYDPDTGIIWKVKIKSDWMNFSPYRHPVYIPAEFDYWENYFECDPEVELFALIRKHNGVYRHTFREAFLEMKHDRERIRREGFRV